MIEDPEGVKKDVAEVKFLIHDLRVESFINEVIHYHVTVNTDLEVYNGLEITSSLVAPQAIYAEACELTSSSIPFRYAMQRAI